MNLELCAYLRPLNLIYMKLQEVVSMTLGVYMVSIKTVLIK